MFFLSDYQVEFSRGRKLGAKDKKKRNLNKVRFVSREEAKRDSKMKERMMIQHLKQQKKKHPFWYSAVP